MPQSLAQIHVHMVFSTTHRQPLLRDAALRERLHAYIAGTCRNLDSPALKVGGNEDHAHALHRLSKNVAPMRLLQEVKRAFSVWMNDQSPTPFQWQAGYGVFSVGPSDVEAVAAYIRDQERHHRSETFQEEFRRLLRQNGVEWDERYVWD